MDTKQTSWQLGDLLDLEQASEADASISLPEQRERDTRWVKGTTNKSGQALIKNWLAHVLGDRSQSEKANGIVKNCGLLATTLGFLLGVGLVWGWVISHLDRPINVLHFWFVAVGVQLMFLVPGILFVVGTERKFAGVPVIEQITALTRAFVQLFAWCTRWAVGKFGTDMESGEFLNKLRTKHQRLMLLVAARMTQGFAIAFNLGAILSLVVAGYMSDPALGWRSALMEGESVHRMAQVVAAPWQWSGVSEAPTLFEVTETRFTELDAKYEKSAAAGERPWNAWWGWLFGSLLVYGLLPRLIIAGLFTGMIQKQLRTILQTHPLVLRIQRLKHALAGSTQLNDEERDSVPGTSSSMADVMQNEARLETQTVLVWSGVSTDVQALRDWLGTKAGCIVDGVHAVGSLDPEDDLNIVRELDVQSGVVIVVNATESPSGEYLDFLTGLRHVLSRDVPIRVVLFDRDLSSHAAYDNQFAVWKRAVGKLGDDHLAMIALDRRNG